MDSRDETSLKLKAFYCIFQKQESYNHANVRY